MKAGHFLFGPGAILALVLATGNLSAAQVAWGYQGSLVDSVTGGTEVIAAHLNAGASAVVEYSPAPGGDTSGSQTVNLASISLAFFVTPDQVFGSSDFRLSLRLQDLASGDQTTLSVLGDVGVNFTLVDDPENGRPEPVDIISTQVTATFRDGQSQSATLGGRSYEVTFLAREAEDGNAYLDAEVKVTDSPEPATWVLAAVGLLAAGVGAARRSAAFRRGATSG